MAKMGRPVKAPGTHLVRVNAGIPPDVRAKLEAIALGTRRPMAQVLVLALERMYDEYLREGKL